MLAEHPDRIDLTVLSQFPELKKYRAGTGRGRRASSSTVPVAVDTTSTPEERIEAAYEELQQAFADEIQQRVIAMSPAAFEDLVLDVLHAMGYGDEGEGARLRTGASGDAGIEGVIREDRLGLDFVYVQAKRWQAIVGRPEVQAFVGALQGARAAKGIIFSASQFSNDARQYAATVSPRVVLVDGHRLAELMIDYDVGVAGRENYTVKRLDTDYFGEDA